MDTKGNLNELEQAWKTVYIIWIAMLCVLFIYLLIGLSLEERISTSIDKKILNILTYIFYAISAVIFFSIKYVRNFILKSKNSNASGGVISDNPAIANYIKATIASLALAESISVLGLALFILGKRTIDLYFLICVSAWAMIYYRPFKEQMAELIDEK